MKSEGKKSKEEAKLPPLDTVNTNSQSRAFRENIRENDDDNKSKRPRSVKPDRKKGGGVGILGTVIIALMVGVIGFAVGTRFTNVSTVKVDYSILNEVYNKLSTKYDGKIDKDKLTTGAAKGMTSSLGDPYTEYMTAKEYEEISNDLNGSLQGIGVEIGLNKDGLLSIISTLDGSPAQKAGLKGGDLIEKINDKDATSYTTSEAASKIRGKKGTKVKLTVVRDDKEKKFEVMRDNIKNPSVKYEIKDSIGYIRISTFGDDTAELTEKAADEMVKKNVKGIVLDLRDNTGGYVDAARAVCSLWIDEGKIITVEKSDKATLSNVTATGGNVLKDISTVVLINGFSASASEITAGALHDSANAKLVGTKSFGKGLVQEVVDLSNGDKLKVTVAKWYTPKGKNINKQGISPDYKIDMTAKQYNSGNDTQRNKANDLIKKGW